MKKMPTLFKRNFDGKSRLVLNEVTPGCEWVLNGEGIPTRKLDGTCCMVQDGKLYARFDLKPGRKLPSGAIPCQPEADVITGHFPHWVPVDDDPQYKYHRAAFERLQNPENGTYELIGPHFMKNPDSLVNEDSLLKHGCIVLDDMERTFDGIKDYLKHHYIEGIVFHHPDGRMCKIKRTDFGFVWNEKKNK